MSRNKKNQGNKDMTLLFKGPDTKLALGRLRRLLLRRLLQVGLGVRQRATLDASLQICVQSEVVSLYQGMCITCVACLLCPFE